MASMVGTGEGRLLEIQKLGYADMESFGDSLDGFNFKIRCMLALYTL